LDSENLEAMGDVCQWPEYVEVIWERLGDSKGSGPKFLAITKIETFFAKLLYLPVARVCQELL